ncbi:hypothetical protein PCYB_135100 [Plasmodium cynomolgi strain B]|uniref:CobW/HypB/UreG nucleotide-binding domain-containing protein n=1 Tax=Plasmodium cynomolgi (strain B) TaxID=1120755 RepID=K6UEN0_PLACD|nr:hypothetical protein PCYB_135100 [Plasmodium cynomolgi strain B]GAB68636.1 hypothetical protein PCYB_135100 [Plasmodium cynomolgi strain B]
MIGITIITGFLGAGKTTLLKNLLKESLRNGKKIAIIHNEFTENNNNIDKIVFKDINDIYNFPKEGAARGDARGGVGKDEQNGAKSDGHNEAKDRTKSDEQNGAKDITKGDGHNGAKDITKGDGHNGAKDRTKSEGQSDLESDQNDITIVNRIEKEEGYIYELNNGCLCCSNKSNFVKLIENILAMKSSYDYIFVEVAGVYDNIQLNNLLWLDDLNKSQIYLDSIVYVLDAYNLVNSFQGGDSFPCHGALAEAASQFAATQAEKEQNLPCGEEEERRNQRNVNLPPGGTPSGNEQLIVCDVVIINKVDKITEQEKEKIKSFVRNMNPLSSIYLTSYATLPMEQLTELKCYEKKNIKDVLENSMNSHTADRKHVFHYNDFVNCSLKYEHSIPYLVHLSEKLNKMKNKFVQAKSKSTLRQILSSKKKNIFSFKKINETLVSLLWSKNLEIYRGKGVFVAFNDDVYTHKSKLKLNMYYYQSVGDLYEIDLIMSDLHTFFLSALDGVQSQMGSVSVLNDNENDGSIECPNHGNDHSIEHPNHGDDHSIEHPNHGDDHFIEHPNHGDDISDIENYLSDSSSRSEESDSRGGGEYNVKSILSGGDVFTSCFLFIGKHIDVEGVKRKLNNCLDMRSIQLKGFFAWKILGDPRHSNNLSATNSIYCDISLEFIPIKSQVIN